MRYIQLKDFRMEELSGWAQVSSL